MVRARADRPASAEARDARPARSVQVGGRIVHQLAPALEQVGAGVDRLDFVLRDACATAVTLFTLLNRDFRFVCSTCNP